MKVYKCGPSGGMGGHEFSDDALAETEKVRSIRIRSGALVDAIGIAYGENVHNYPWHGGEGGELQVPFDLDADEYIMGISGRCGDKVDSIRIHTNKQVSPAYGQGNCIL